MSKSDYDEGYLAGLEGCQLWENPHSGEDSRKAGFDYWFAGWCAGTKACGHLERSDLRRIADALEDIVALAKQDMEDND